MEDVPTARPRARLRSFFPSEVAAPAGCRPACLPGTGRGVLPPNRGNPGKAASFKAASWWRHDRPLHHRVGRHPTHHRRRAIDDRAWWTEESRASAPAWPAVIDAALEDHGRGRVIRPEQSTFELACEQADRKRQPHPSRQEIARPGAPATTVGGRSCSRWGGASTN